MRDLQDIYRVKHPLHQQTTVLPRKFTGLDREARLSRLCGMLLRVAITDQPYGLRLPGIVIEPDRGESHRQYLLAELALFDTPQRERQQ